MDNNCRKQLTKPVLRLLNCVWRSNKRVQISWSTLFPPKSTVFHLRGPQTSKTTGSGFSSSINCLRVHAELPNVNRLMRHLRKWGNWPLYLWQRYCYRRQVEKDATVSSISQAFQLPFGHGFPMGPALPHYAVTIWKSTDQKFPNRWMGRVGPISSPARSLDLPNVASFLEIIWEAKYYTSYSRIFLASRRNFVMQLKVLREKYSEGSPKILETDFRL